MAVDGASIGAIHPLKSSCECQRSSAHVHQIRMISLRFLPFSDDFLPSKIDSLSTLRWVPICQGFSRISGFLHHFVLAKLAPSSIRVNYVVVYFSTAIAWTWLAGGNAEWSPGTHSCQLRGIPELATDDEEEWGYLAQDACMQVLHGVGGSQTGGSVVLANRVSGHHLDTTSLENHPSRHPKNFVRNLLKCQFQSCSGYFHMCILQSIGKRIPEQPDFLQWILPEGVATAQLQNLLSLEVAMYEQGVQHGGCRFLCYFLCIFGILCQHSICQLRKLTHNSTWESGFQEFPIKNGIFPKYPMFGSTQADILTD